MQKKVAFAFRIDTITSYNPYQNELELNIDFRQKKIFERKPWFFDRGAIGVQNLHCICGYKWDMKKATKNCLKKGPEFINRTAPSATAEATSFWKFNLIHFKYRKVAYFAKYNRYAFHIHAINKFNFHQFFIVFFSFVRSSATVQKRIYQTGMVLKFCRPEYQF